MPPSAQAVQARFRQMAAGFSRSQMAIIGLMSVVAIIAAVALLRWVSTPSYQVLVSGVDAKNVAAVTDKLKSDGVPYKLAAGGTTILVPASSVDSEKVAISAAGIGGASSTNDGWSVLDKSGLTSSSFQQQVAYQRGLESQLESTLKKMSGVQDATVHIVLPQDQLFTDQKQPARASVQLDTVGMLGQDAVDSVVHTVASAVPDLDPTAVTVTDTKGRLLSDATGGTSGGADRQLQAQQTYEDILTARADQILTQVLGPGHSAVQVHAEIDPSKRTVDSETYDPKKTAVLTQAESKEGYTTSSPTPSSGVLTNAPTTASGNGKDSYSKTDTQTTYGVTRTVEHQEYQPGAVKRITVAVAVDANIPNPPTTAELQSLVGNAVGIDATRGDSIAVTSEPFYVPKVAKPSAGKKAAAGFAGVGKSLPSAVAVALLLIVGLGFLRAARRVHVVELPVPASLAALAGSSPATAIGAGAERELESASHGALGSSSALAALPAGRSAAGEDEVLQVIDQRPDEVAQLLRSWLADVGSNR